MKIIDEDIEKYTAYLEYAIDKLNKCHPLDEIRFMTIIFGYKEVIDAMRCLKEIETD